MRPYVRTAQDVTISIFRIRRNFAPFSIRFFCHPFRSPYPKIIIFHFFEMWKNWKIIGWRSHKCDGKWSRRQSGPHLWRLVRIADRGQLGPVFDIPLSTNQNRRKSHSRIRAEIGSATGRGHWIINSNYDRHTVLNTEADPGLINFWIIWFDIKIYL